MDNYGTRLKAILNVKGIKQVELAEAVGSNPKNISSYIAGRSEPAPDMANRIAKYLDVPIDYFLGNINLEKAFGKKDPMIALAGVKEYLSDDIYEIVELFVMLKDNDIGRIFEIIKKLSPNSIREVMKQAEKELVFDSIHKSDE